MLFLSRVSWQSKKAKIADIHTDLSKCYLCGELLWVSGPGASSGGLFGAASGGPWYATHRHVYGRLEILALFCWTFFFSKTVLWSKWFIESAWKVVLEIVRWFTFCLSVCRWQSLWCQCRRGWTDVLCRFGCKADYSAGYAGQSSGTNLFGAGRCDNHSLQLQQLQSLVPQVMQMHIKFARKCIFCFWCRSNALLQSFYLCPSPKPAHPWPWGSGATFGASSGGSHRGMWFMWLTDAESLRGGIETWSLYPM